MELNGVNIPMAVPSYKEFKNVLFVPGGKPGTVTIARYQFFIQQGTTKLSVDLPTTVTAFEVPSGITAAGGTFKFEIIARTAKGNNTAVESCFNVQ